MLAYLILFKHMNLSRKNSAKQISVFNGLLSIIRKYLVIHKANKLKVQKSRILSQQAAQIIDYKNRELYCF